MHDSWDPVMAECYLNELNTDAHRQHGARRSSSPIAVRETVISHTLIDVRTDTTTVEIDRKVPSTIDV